MPPPRKKGRAGSDIHQCRLVITVRNPFAPNDTCVRSAGQLKGEFTNAKPHCLAPPGSSLKRPFTHCLVPVNAFKIEPKDGTIYLKGVVSRKKQLIPPLMEAAQMIGSDYV